MSEFQQEEQQEDDNSKFRSELEDVGIKSQVIDKLLRIKNDISMKLYSKEIEAARKIKVNTAGEISTHFIGQEIAGREAIRRIMFVALVNGVLRADTPFRRLWYQFVKASLQALATEFALTGAFYGGMSKMIKDTGLDYKDFGITNLGEKDEETGKRQLARGVYEVKPELEHVFPNVMLGIEDASYYSVFKNMAELLGLHRYTASGQSSLSSTEVITDDLKEKVETRDDYPLQIRNITDYDPAGFNISNAYLDHFSRYLGNMITSKRFAPLMKHYTLDELVQNIYMVKLSMISQSVWDKERGDLEKYAEAYKKKTGVNFNESNEWHTKAQELLRSHGSIYEKGVRKGLGKAPKQSEWKKFPEPLKNDILDFIDTELPKELINWWSNIVKGGEEGARPKGLTDDPIDLFYFISRNIRIYPYGIELASVPEIPLEPAYSDEGNGEPIYDYTNPQFIKGSHHEEGTGQARMRLLTFDEIVGEFGLENALKHYFNLKKPDLDWEAKRLYSDETEKGIREVPDANYDSRDLLLEIEWTLDAWFEDYISDEKGKLKEAIQEWIDLIFDKYTHPLSVDYDKELAEQEKKKIWVKLRKAILNDNREIYFSFPESFDHTEYGYAEDYRIIIPDEIFESLRPITNWAKCIKLNIKTVKELLDNYDYNDLEQDWSTIIPKIFSCDIIDGEAIQRETLETDCSKYIDKITELNQKISDLLGRLN